MPVLAVPPFITILTFLELVSSKAAPQDQNENPETRRKKKACIVVYFFIRNLYKIVQ